MAVSVGVWVKVGDAVTVSDGSAVSVGSGKSVGVAFGAISVEVAVTVGFTNPAEGAAGNSFVLQANTPRTRQNPESRMIQFLKFLVPLLPLPILRMDGV